MKQNKNWIFGIIGLLVGLIAGVMIGQDYERKRMINLSVELTNQEAQEARQKTDRYIDSLKKAHPEIFKP